MAIQLIETTELEPEVSALDIHGVPVSANREVSPEQLWDYYRKLQQPSTFKSQTNINETHNDNSVSD